MNGNGWKQWIAQAILTVLLTALAAFGGIKAGLSEAKEQLASVKTSQAATDRRLDRFEDATIKRLDRIEDKVDGLKARR